MTGVRRTYLTLRKMKGTKTLLSYLIFLIGLQWKTSYGKNRLKNCCFWVSRNESKIKRGGKFRLPPVQCLLLEIFFQRLIV